MTIKNGRYKYTEVIIRPSAALRNNYSEISRTCREDRTPVIITNQDAYAPADLPALPTDVVAGQALFAAVKQ